MTTVEKKWLNPLVEHELALKVYLDSLLFEAPPVAESDDIAIPPPQVVRVATGLVCDELPAVTLPEWSKGVFESLHFKVGGFLMLSVPLARLGGIVPWPGKLTAVPGYADWFLGLLPSRGRQVKVIDIAKFVIPENHKARNTLASGKRQFKYIILIDDGRLGLACDELNGILKLTQGQVRWRSDRTTRPWLAGTIIEQMCALLDIDNFVAMLKEEVPSDDITGEV